MISELTTAIAGLKAAGELGAFMLKIKVDSTVADKVRESQTAISTAQIAMLEVNLKYLELLNEANDLKKRLIEMEDWKTEAAKYTLKDIDSGIFVYAANPDQQSPAPLHWLCANCYDSKRKSILQRTSGARGIGYVCHHCQNSLRTSAVL